MENAIIGLLGVVLGIVLTELLRRRSRVEFLLSKAFEKRLNVYDELFGKLNEGISVAHDVIDNPEYSKDDRSELWGTVVLDVFQFFDANKLYLNEDITIHCMMTMIGVEEMFYIEDKKQKEKERAKFSREINDAKEMIKKETGLAELDNLFRSITKAKHESNYLDYVNKLKAKHAKKSKRK